MTQSIEPPTGHEALEATPLSRRRELLIGRLRRRKSRQRERLFLVEGVRCARQVLDAGVVPRFAVCSPGLDRTAAGMALHRRLRRGDLVEVPDTRLAALAGTTTPQGVLLVCEQPMALAAEVLPGARRVVVVDGIQDPGNLGTLIRAAAGFGLDAVVTLDGTVDPFNAKGVRASAGAVAQIPIVSHAWEAVEPLLSHLPFLVAIASEPAEPRPADSWALIIGSEAGGPRPPVVAAADTRVGVPMAAGVESLNAAVAGAVLMYALSRDPST